MKQVLLIFLFTMSPAFADDQNVYDFFRQLPNTDNAIVDEQTTALIKRHMATLLYPVDMGSFARPEKDAKFREQVIALQKQSLDLLGCVGAVDPGNLATKKTMCFAGTISAVAARYLVIMTAPVDSQDCSFATFARRERGNISASRPNTAVELTKAVAM
jgi:hypothetical protein